MHNTHRGDCDDARDCCDAVWRAVDLVQLAKIHSATANDYGPSECFRYHGHRCRYTAVLVMAKVSSSDRIDIACGWRTVSCLSPHREDGDGMVAMDFRSPPLHAADDANCLLLHRRSSRHSPYAADGRCIDTELCVWTCADNGVVHGVVDGDG